MAFKEREESSDVSKARTRLAGMKKIDSDKGKVIEYGGDVQSITSLILEDLIKDYTAKVESYNQVLKSANSKANEIDIVESKIKKMHATVLSSAPGKFGEDANEIEVLGGTRASDRKPTTRTAKAK